MSYFQKIVFVLIIFIDSASYVGAENLRDITGTWIGWENGNKIIMELQQQGNSVTGTLRFPDIHGRAAEQVRGKVSVSVRAWDVLRFEWSRSGEPSHHYIGYTMTHGTRAGKAMAGYFHRSASGVGPEGNLAWFAER